MKQAIKFNLLDTTIALNLAFFVNAAILVLAAAAFYVNGYFHIAEIQDASVLLEKLFGKTAPAFCYCIDCFRSKLNDHRHFSRANCNGRPFKYQDTPMAKASNYKVACNNSGSFYHSLFWSGALANFLF